jgi:hypothetical protein
VLNFVFVVLVLVLAGCDGLGTGLAEHLTQNADHAGAISAFGSVLSS